MKKIDWTKVAVAAIRAIAAIIVAWLIRIPAKRQIPIVLTVTLQSVTGR